MLRAEYSYAHLPHLVWPVGPRGYRLVRDCLLGQEKLDDLLAARLVDAALLQVHGDDDQWPFLQRLPMAECLGHRREVPGDGTYLDHHDSLYADDGPAIHHV